MRSKTAVALALITATAALTASTTPLSAAHEAPGGLTLEEALLEVTPGRAWTAQMRTRNFTVVGHDDLGGGGLNADIWEHAGYAYVGVWSGPCPATGVKVVDVRRPSAPTMVSRLQNPARTSAEDVVVRRVRTDWFTGDLAVTGIQTCRNPRSGVFRGLQFFDVTHPERPRLLGRFRAPAGTVGCHEVDLTVNRTGRVLAGCANNFAELTGGSDEVLVVDASNPARPREVAGFAIGSDLGVDPGHTAHNVGCFPASFAHSVRFTNQGRRLFVSYWDYGTLRFDVAGNGRLGRPDGRSDLAPPDEDADNHSMTLARAGRTMVVNQEDFSPLGCGDEFGGWGAAKVYDNGNGRNRLVSTFSTPHSRSMRTDGIYSAHNTEAAGRGRAQMFSSWYTDGIVWWSLADRRNPEMVGQFVPPPTEDPTGTFPPVPLVWGVFTDRSKDLVLASDINSGLWILRPKGLPRL